MKKVLILCTGNSCRSQMAHGILNKIAGTQGSFWSAGVETHGLNPNAVKYLGQRGIDITKHTSNLISEYEDINFDYIITVCDNAKERCPYFPSEALKIHHNFTDPSKVNGTDNEIEQAFNNTIDEIQSFCEKFQKQYL